VDQYITMSLDSPKANKMMTAAPEKKEFHFAATTDYYAQVVYAFTSEEATEIYHKVKCRINTLAGEPAQSTATPEITEETNS
jgi:hypothetical protein